MRPFEIVSGPDVRAVLRGREGDVVELVRSTYLAHDAGQTVNPDSHFLRFPDRPDSRIIALPAHVGGTVNRSGIKWISSFPANLERGLPRASAVLVINDHETGSPIALLESAAISSARTAASAALAAATLQRSRPTSVGIVGGGVIAREICRYLAAIDEMPAVATCHDVDESRAGELAALLATLGGGVQARTGSLAEALDADLVVLATTALAPYVGEDTPLRPEQTLLNVSLRDLEPGLLLRTANVLDDVSHCLKAQTSPHLAEQLTGSRDFVTGTLAEVISGAVALPTDRATVFSPFGLGVLDVALGDMVLGLAQATGRTTAIEDFFADEFPATAVAHGGA